MDCPEDHPRAQPTVLPPPIGPERPVLAMTVKVFEEEEEEGLQKARESKGGHVPIVGGGNTIPILQHVNEISILKHIVVFTLDAIVF